MDTIEGNLLNKALALEPTLTGFGINSKGKYEDDTIPLEEFIACLDWLAMQKQGNEINTMLTSYTLKHCVEEWFEERNKYHKYISNGAMIAAIIAKGLPYKKYKDNPNVSSTIYFERSDDDE
jgi:hypothetical protein